MTELLFLKDSYQKTTEARVVSVTKHGSLWDIVLDQTIFYPQGGGQPSDKGIIAGASGKARVKHVRMQSDIVIHECTIEGNVRADETVTCTLDWQTRYTNMKIHSAGHIVHEAVMQTVSNLQPIKGEHGSHAYIEYKGSIPLDKKNAIQGEVNDLIKKNLALTTELVSLEELKTRSSYVPEHLPKHKPLRILTIEGFQAIPDGGTQVAKSSEIGSVYIEKIDHVQEDHVRVHYRVEDEHAHTHDTQSNEVAMSAPQCIGLLLEAQQRAIKTIETSHAPPQDIRMELFGPKSELTNLMKNIRLVPKEDRTQVGTVLNQIKQQIEEALDSYAQQYGDTSPSVYIDVTAPGIRPPQGHLHIVSQAIEEITRIFERISFTRVHHPEVDWDWYAFESLNMPKSHPARDEWETFFIQYPGKPGKHPKKQKMVLTPHTSNGQVREMEKKQLPIRMINIAKCYRRQSDISHVPMFHQFEGLYVDTHVSIGHLKGVLDYFVKQFFGVDRVTRLRPFHFQFTEPSFEIDISCGVCLGKGCRLCKEGWLELGGAGMVHPEVLKNGGIDTNTYNGFAFGWGVERTYMMKAGTKLDDIRLLYSNDIRFLEQF
jgi:phenylalanyl-tRNA synthetase alpha chain